MVLAKTSGQTNIAEEISKRLRLQLYQAGKPYHEP